MPQPYGTIKEDGRVVFEDLLIRYKETQNKKSDLKKWNGSFELSSGSYIEPGGPFRLTLADGRSGNIFIENMQMSGRGSSVRFKESGPLE